MTKMNNITAKRVTQYEQEFFIGIFTIQKLLSYTKYTERVITGFDENGKPIYNNQVQRKANNAKVQRIADFLINDDQATFPTNIVLAIPEEAIEEISSNEDTYEIILQDKVKKELARDEGTVFISIIDGQHRIKGVELAIKQLSVKISNLDDNERDAGELSELKEKLTKLKTLQVVVTFFIAPTLEYQAMIFSTINRTQTKVSESLVYSLFGLTETDSPQKSSLEIILTLNGYKKSPFYNRIRLYGYNYKRGEGGLLTQAGMVKSIVKLISKNTREAEIDRYKTRDELEDLPKEKYPFRTYYKGNNDVKIIKILIAYFRAVRDTFMVDEKSLWTIDSNKPENILQTTVGYDALLSILCEILTKIDDDESITIKRTYIPYLEKAQGINFTDNEKYTFTSVSKKLLYDEMYKAIFKED